MCPARSSTRGSSRGARRTAPAIPDQQAGEPSRHNQRSRSRGSSRPRGQRGASSHNRVASRNGRNERDPRSTNALSPPAHFPPSALMIVQNNVYTHLTVEGMTHHLQTQESTGYVVDGVFIATSRVMTRTGSTGSYTMEYGSSMEAYTPASEPPEPWPYRPGGHHLDNVGAQFAAEGMHPQATANGLGDMAVAQEEYSCYPPVMVVLNDGEPGQLELAGMPDLDNGHGFNYDQAELLSLDPSKAYLESQSDEDWLRPITSVPRAFTFPLLGQYNVNIDESLADEIGTLQVTTY